MITKPVFCAAIPKSGKTTVGKELAKQLGVSFLTPTSCSQGILVRHLEEIFCGKGRSLFPGSGT